jgi:uncharacterized membrane protein
LSADKDLLERIGTIGAGTALIAAAYYLWILGGYLNSAYTVIQWVLTISGAVLIARALTLEPVTTKRTFEGRAGLVVGSAFAAIALYVTVVEGWVQPGYLLIEAFLYGLAAFIIINASFRRPLFDDEGVASTAALVGLAAVSVIFAYASSTIGGGIIMTGAFLACGALALAGFALKKLYVIYPVVLLFMIALFALLLMKSIPQFSTDELAIDAYAAHLLLSGANPYIPSLMNGALSYYHLSSYYQTPLTTGGYVSQLGYPALSFLIYVPALLLDLQPRAVLVALSIALLLVVYLRYRNLRRLALLSLLVIVVNVNIIYYPVGSVPDVVWALLLALSLVLRRRPWVAGALFGLSIASKQIAAIVLPYYLYMIYRERGRKGASIFTGSMLAAFMAFNLPFIILSPASWASAILLPETYPLLGIGQGIGMLSFLGYYQLPSYYFTAMEAFAALALLFLYIIKYNKYKYSFLAFPMIIFFFNFRFLFNYIIYWPVLAILVAPEATRERRPEATGVSWRSLEVAVVAALLIVPAGGALYLHSSPGPYTVTGVSGYSDYLSLPGYITSMTVNVTGPAWQVLFRIFPSGSMTAINGLLWSTSNISRGDGWALYTIIPSNPSYALPQGTPFRLEAYYGGNQTFIDEVSPLLSPSHLLTNPEFLLFTSSQTPGWSFNPSRAGGTAGYSSANGSVTLTADKVSGGWAASQLLQPINLSVLYGYRLSYNVSIIGPASDIGPGENPDVAIGVQIDGGPYEIWYLFNPNQLSMSVYRPNQHTLVIISNSTSLSFSDAYSRLVGLGWTPGDGMATLMFIAGSQYTDGRVAATFSNLTLEYGQVSL